MWSSYRQRGGSVRYYFQRGFPYPVILLFLKKYNAMEIYIVSGYPAAGKCFKTYYIPGSLKLFENFHGKTHPILLKTGDLYLEMSSDFNNNFGFVVEETFEHGHIIKSRCFDT